MGELTGLFVPLITPFTADGELAAAVLERLAHRVLDDGATGIVALGTTAEAATLSNRSAPTVLQICSQVCGDRGTPLIAGAGTNDTARSAEALTRLSGLSRRQRGPRRRAVLRPARRGGRARAFQSAGCSEPCSGAYL